jgi:hypothetical protein
MSDSSGPEFVVKRIKSIKHWYLNRLGGGDDVLPGVALKNNRIKGPLSCIFKLKKPRLVIDLLTCIYTGYVAEHVTTAQWEKFHSSVVREQGPDIFIPFLQEATKEVTLVDFPESSYRSYPFTGKKRVPALNGKTGPNVIARLADDFRTSGVWDVLDRDSHEYVISHALDDIYPGLLEIPEDLDHPDPYVGRIGVIQERGLKARFIASPRLVYQIGLRALGKYLFRLLKNCPWDCTYNQMAGVKWAKEKLRTNSRLWSVDISDASNNMPFSSTLRVLRWLECPPQDLELFESISRGKWLVPRHIASKIKVNRRGNICRNAQNDDPTETDGVEKSADFYIRWNQGQPLGLYPSFPAFALWHGLVLRSIEIRFKLSDTFRVLGDDVIISNSLVHWAYRNLMDKLTVPVSLTKTLTGIKAGEFAGNIITRKSTFLARKFIIPTADNYCFRLFKGTENNPERITTPEQLASFAVHASSLDENPCGISLEGRANFVRLLWDGSAPLHGVIIPHKSKRLYNELFSTVDRVGEQKTICRDDLEFIEMMDEQLLSDVGFVSTRHVPFHVLSLVLIKTGVYETLLPDPLGKEFKKYLMERCIWKGENFSPTEVGRIFDRTLGTKRSILGKLKRKIFKSQLDVHRKSESIVKQELASIFIALLDDEDPPAGDFIIRDTCEP